VYPISVRQVVAVAPASFRPRLAATPLPSLNGSDSLDHRGLPPPRTNTCTAYDTGRDFDPGLIWPSPGLASPVNDHRSRTDAAPASSARVPIGYGTWTLHKTSPRLVSEHA